MDNSVYKLIVMAEADLDKKRKSEECEKEMTEKIPLKSSGF